jgi:hypothetical protein
MDRELIILYSIRNLVISSQAVSNGKLNTIQYEATHSYRGSTQFTWIYQERHEAAAKLVCSRFDSILSLSGVMFSQQSLMLCATQHATNVGSEIGTHNHTNIQQGLGGR